MRRARFAAVTALAALVGLIATAVASAEPPPGVKTTKPPYLVPTAPGVVVDPILSTGDIVGTYQMSGIPDGLGAYANRRDRGRGKTFTVVMNHELGRSFPNNPPGVDARISRLRIDAKTTSVVDATYLFDGTEGFERFCSSTLEIIRGVPYYFTGEEAIPQPMQPPGPAHDGSSIVMNAETGEWTETPHFGHLQHENVVPIRLSKWVFLTTDDDFRAGQPAYLYAYIAPTFRGGVAGTQGSLYVWKANDPAETGNATAAKGESIPGRFVPITQAENANDVTLKDAATAKGAFKFDRLEDAAVRSLTSNRVYIADTGKLPATERGRVYQFTFSRNNPTRATLRMILNGDAPDSDDLFNPDNMDVSRRALVIQEDRESAFRGDVGGTTGFSRVLVYDLKSKTLRSVARVNTPATLRPGTWESSGVIDARHVLGRNWWLLDVQAHSTTAPQPGPTLEPNSSTGEDGQLLAIRIPRSQ
jgi:Bacterial protein of unknown function (DUF839)